MVGKHPLPVFLLLAATFSCISGAALKKEDIFENFNKKVTSGDNLKTDHALMESPFAELRSSMKFAPVCLSILGKMNLISTQKDINLLEVGKQEGTTDVVYKHLKAPESLRASLAQLGHAAYWAFNEANGAMNEIADRSEKVPDHLKKALKTLFKGSDGEIKAYFPIHMRNIKDIADKCVTRAQNVSTSYSQVLLIAQDLSVAAIRAQGLTDREKDENDRQKKIAETETTYNRQRKQELDARMDDARKIMLERNKAFKEAQENMQPNEWEKFGMELFKSLPGMLMNVGEELAKPADKRNWGEMAISAISKGLSGSFKAYDDELKKFFEEKPQPERKQNQPDRQPRNLDNLKTTFATRDVAKEAKKLNDIVKFIDYFFNKDHSLNTKALSTTNKNWKTADVVLSELTASVKKITTLIEDGAKKKFSKKVIGFMDDLQELVESLKKLANSPDANGKEGEKEYLKLLDLKKEINAMMKTEVALYEHDLTFSKKSPDSPKDEGRSDREQLSDASFALDLAERKLREAEKRMDVLSAEEQQLSKTILNTMKNLQNYKITEQQLGEQLEILSQGIKAVAQLQKEWDKLVRYFQGFALRVDTLLGTPLNTFVDLAKVNYENELYKDVANRVSKEQLYQLAYSTSISAHDIHNEAAAYVELSETHFMPVVAELIELISLDRDKDKDEIKRREIRIDQQANEMWTKIDENLRDREKEFDEAVEGRIKELKELFNYEIVEKLPEELKSQVFQIQEETKEITNAAYDDFLNDL